MGNGNDARFVIRLR